MKKENASSKKKTVAPKKPAAADKKPDVKIEIIQTEVRYTDKEVAEFGREAARLKPEIAAFEEQLDSIKTDYKSKIDGLELKRNSISDKIIRGFEMRPAECVVEFNVPKKGKKSFWIHDPANKKDGKGAFVREEDMSAADMQTDFFADKKPAVESQAGFNNVLSEAAAQKAKKEAEAKENEKAAAKEKPEAGGEDEPLLLKVVEAIREKKICNTAFVQRNFKIGHGPATRLLNVLEERGIVGPEKADKQRDILPFDGEEEKPEVKAATPESIKAAEDADKKK